MSDNTRLSLPPHLRAALIEAGWKPPRVRSKRVRETPEMVAMVRRQLRGLAARVTRGDVEDLAALVDLRDDLAQVIDIAVTGLVDTGVSYGEIGRRLGITRQAVRQRWGVSAS